MPTEAYDRQRKFIRRLFGRIAHHYDRINRFLSLGQDQRWRRAALAAADVPPGGRLLDVATGTGDLALLARRCEPAPWVVGTDLTSAMLRQAQRKAEDAVLPLVVGDGLALPFADSTFDAVVSAFLMRNVPDVRQAFSEQWRVVRPGGRVVCLEMTWPRGVPMRWLLAPYFFGLSPLLGRLIAGAPEAYRYLPKSVKDFMSPSSLAELMMQVGFRDVSWQAMMLGVVVIHVGTKLPGENMVV